MTEEKNKFGKLEWKRIGVAIFLLIFAMIVAFNAGNVKLIAKHILESNYIYLFFSAYIFTAIVLNEINNFNRNNIDLVSFIFHFVHEVLGYIGAATGSITLMRSVFLQYYYKDSRFINFDGVDLISVVIMSFILLTFTTIKATEMIGGFINEKRTIHINKDN
jgi:hypothetical protein